MELLNAALFATLTIALAVVLVPISPWFLLLFVLAVLICAGWNRINPAPEDVDIKIRFEWVKLGD